jgi:aspartate 1-decarboxylase
VDAYRKLLGGKIHRAVVTHADLEYEGSITTPRELLSAAGICPYEAVQIWNVTSGSRFETYAIEGCPGSNAICINGAAAHHASPGDVIIIAAFRHIHEHDVAAHKPKLVFVDEQNRILSSSTPELPGPALRMASNS